MTVPPFYLKNHIIIHIIETSSRPYSVLAIISQHIYITKWLSDRQVAFKCQKLQRAASHVARITWFQKVTTFLAKMAVVTDNFCYAGQVFIFNQLESSKGMCHVKSPSPRIDGLQPERIGIA